MALPDQIILSFNKELYTFTGSLRLSKEIPPTANNAAATKRAVTGSITVKPNNGKNQEGAINNGIANK